MLRRSPFQQLFLPLLGIAVSVLLLTLSSFGWAPVSFVTDSEVASEPSAIELDSIFGIGEGVEADLAPAASSIDVIGSKELQLEHVDDTYELFELFDRFGDFVLAHATVHYDLPWGTLGIELSILLDEFNEYVFDFAQSGRDTGQAPGDSRNVSLSWKFGL